MNDFERHDFLLWRDAIIQTNCRMLDSHYFSVNEDLYHHQMVFYHEHLDPTDFFISAHYFIKLSQSPFLPEIPLNISDEYKKSLSTHRINIFEWQL